MAEIRYISQKGAYNAIKWPQTSGLPNTAPKNLRNVSVALSPFGSGTVGSNKTPKRFPNNTLHSSRLRELASKKSATTNSNSPTRVPRMSAALCFKANKELKKPSIISASGFIRPSPEMWAAGLGLGRLAKVIVALSSFFPQPTENVGQFALLGIGALQQGCIAADPQERGMHQHFQSVRLWRIFNRPDMRDFLAGINRQFLQGFFLGSPLRLLALALHPG